MKKLIWADWFLYEDALSSSNPTRPRVGKVEHSCVLQVDTGSSSPLSIISTNAHILDKHRSQEYMVSTIYSYLLFMVAGAHLVQQIFSFCCCSYHFGTVMCIFFFLLYTKLLNSTFNLLHLKRVDIFPGGGWKSGWRGGSILLFHDTMWCVLHAQFT